MLASLKKRMEEAASEVARAEAVLPAEVRRGGRAAEEAPGKLPCCWSGGENSLHSVLRILLEGVGMCWRQVLCDCTGRHSCSDEGGDRRWDQSNDSQLWSCIESWVFVGAAGTSSLQM